MKKKYFSFLLLGMLLGSVSLCSAEKFGGSFSEDSMTRQSPPALKEQRTLPTTPILLSTPSLPGQTPSTPNPPQTPEPTVTISEVSLPPMPAANLQNTPAIKNQELPASIASPPSAPVISSAPKGLGDMRKVNMRVPDYEKRYKAYLQAQAIKDKKKKKLIENIFQEFTSWWPIFVLVFVALVLIYAMRKETRPLAPPSSKAKEETPKDIWHEQF